MTTIRDIESAVSRGYEDGFSGRPLPAELPDHLVDIYADARRAGTARSGRLPPPRPTLFDSEFCRAELARPIHAPRLVTGPAGRDGAGVPSSSDEAA